MRFQILILALIGSVSSASAQSEDVAIHAAAIRWIKARPEFAAHNILLDVERTGRRLSGGNDPLVRANEAQLAQVARLSGLTLGKPEAITVCLKPGDGRTCQMATGSAILSSEILQYNQDSTTVGLSYAKYVGASNYPERGSMVLLITKTKAEWTVSQLLKGSVH